MMDDARTRELLDTARVARLATITPDGRPHIVPVTFVLSDDGAAIYHAVDFKPKSTRRLVRVANLSENPSAALLADFYDEDWARLWWVRVDGHGRVVDEAAGDESTRALDLLQRRYAQYAEHRPAGPVIALDIERVSGWEAAG